MAILYPSAIDLSLLKEVSNDANYFSVRINIVCANLCNVQKLEICYLAQKYMENIGTNLSMGQQCAHSSIQLIIILARLCLLQIDFCTE